MQECPVLAPSLNSDFSPISLSPHPFQNLPRHKRLMSAEDMVLLLSDGLQELSKTGKPTECGYQRLKFTACSLQAAHHTGR